MKFCEGESRKYILTLTLLSVLQPYPELHLCSTAGAEFPCNRITHVYVCLLLHCNAAGSDTAGSCVLNISMCLNHAYTLDEQIANKQVHSPVLVVMLLKYPPRHRSRRTQRSAGEQGEMKVRWSGES